MSKDSVNTKEFLKIPVKTVTVKTETVYVAPDVNYPGKVENNCIDVMVSKSDGGMGDKYLKPDTTYGRSMVESATQSKVVWTDAFNNRFGARDLKGGNFFNVKAFRSFYHKYGLDIQGMYLFDEEKVQNLIKISGDLRGKGIPVEAIARVDKIVEFPLVEKVGDEFEVVNILNTDQWKDHLIRGSSTNNILKSLFLPRSGNVEKVLTTDDFYVVTRDMPVAERLSTLLKIKTPESFKKIVGEQFDWLNVATNNGELGIAGDESLPKIGRRLDISNRDDIHYYFVDYLPKYMGSVTAAVHNAGYHMPFAHIQNWTGVGTPVDSEGYKKLEKFNFGLVKEDVWRYLFPKDNQDPSNGIIDIFDYAGVLHKFLDDGVARSAFVRNYLNAYHNRVGDSHLKKVEPPFYSKLYYNLLG